MANKDEVGFEEIGYVDDKDLGYVDKQAGNQKLPKGYENKMLIVLSLAFGFVMFDRFALANLQPYWMPELGLGEAELGLATAVFAASWAVVGFFGSRLADGNLSRKVLLAIAVLIFSIFSMITGFVTGFIMLIIVRLIMGAAEGPVMPVSQSFIIPQSSPNRRGMNMGIMQVAAVGLLSSLLGPIVQVALAESIGWRWTFAVTLIPGIIIAFLIWKVLINPVNAPKPEAATKVAAPKGSYWKALKNRNVLLSVVGTLFLLTWYVCMLTFTPGYLVGAKGFTPTDMSLVMSSFGVGAIVWGIVIPKISDTVGRKPLVFISALLGALSSFGILFAPASLPLLCLIAFFGWGGTGVCALMQSTIPAESGDPNFVASIIGTNQLTGELVGATGGATIMGFLAASYGLEIVLVILGCCMLVCAVISLFYKESAPLVVARRAKKALDK